MIWRHISYSSNQLLAVPVCLAFFLSAFAVQGHTTFLRPLDYRAGPGEERAILVFNGIFGESVDSIPAERIAEILVAGPDGQRTLSEDSWARGEVGSMLWRTWQKAKPLVGGMDHRRTSSISYTPTVSGTYLLSISLHEARVAMNPKTFDAYLEEVGLENEPIAKHGLEDPDIIIRERYKKTAKTLIQAGGQYAGPVTEPAGLESGIVPLQNPFTLDKGQTLTVQLLLKGEPLAGQVLLVGRKGSIRNEPSGRMKLRSGPDGTVEVPLMDDGEWWLEFNHMRRAGENDEVDYVTYWTTLTFEI